MMSAYRRLLGSAAIVAALAVAPAALADEPPASARTVTVYVGTPAGKKIGAREVNAMHARMEKDGWRFAAMAADTENGDTEGLWLTYTRP